MPSDLPRAIATIESSLATHLDWGEWLEKNPDQYDAYKKTVHSPKEQRQIVADYNNVLACLWAAKRREEALLDLQRERDEMLEVIRQIGATIGCSHTDEPDGRMKLVQCVRESVR